MDRRQSKTSNNMNINEEVDKLFKRNKDGLTQKEFLDLRNQYGDVDFVDKLQKAYIHEDNRVTKKAKKVVRVIKEKYADKQLPFHYLLEKVSQFKKKYNFSDAVFVRFQEIFEKELLESKSKEVLIPTTKMMKILGYIDLEYSKNLNKSLSDSDLRSIQEIIKLNSNPLFREKQRQAIMQSHTYKKINAICTEFNPKLGDSNTGPLVHPVIASMFIDKINILDTHFLYSNLANIVDCRFNNKPLEYITDIKLFNALVRDPNDILCNSASPYTDLLSRIKIQHCLWENVINFREGRYYKNPMFNVLLQELEACNLLLGNERSLMYGNSDGTILKRLLNAFSFRPTVIFHMPHMSKIIVNENPFQQFTRPIVTNTSLIYLKPPMNLNLNNTTVRIKLTDAILQQQPVFEHGRMMLKETFITFSNGVLFFYVDRRETKFYDSKLIGTTLNNINLNFSSGIPYSVVSSYDTLSNIEVDVPDTMEINNRTYILRTFVVAETLKLDNNKEVITNSSMLFTDSKELVGGINNIWIRYDPIGLNNTNISSGLNMPMAPINEIRNMEFSLQIDDLKKYKGLIYMYELVDEKTPNAAIVMP
jgi:hypothetical protein